VLLDPLRKLPEIARIFIFGTGLRAGRT